MYFISASFRSMLRSDRVLLSAQMAAPLYPSENTVFYSCNLSDYTQSNCSLFINKNSKKITPVRSWFVSTDATRTTAGEIKLINWIFCQVSSGSLRTGGAFCVSLSRRDFCSSCSCWLFWFLFPSIRSVAAGLTPLCCSPPRGPAPSSSVVSCGSKAGGRGECRRS